MHCQRCQRGVIPVGMLTGRGEHWCTTPTTMKHLLSLLLGLALSVLAHAQDPPVIPIHGSRVSFDHELHDFDTIPFGGNGHCEFILTNVGDEPLIISNFNSSCGCLVPKYDPAPILPGKTSVLKAHYDTRRPGPFRKSLTLTSNAVDRPVLVLGVKGVVLPDPTPAPPRATTTER